jgi:hypothetical protein
MHIIFKMGLTSELTLKLNYEFLMFKLGFLLEFSDTLIRHFCHSYAWRAQQLASHPSMQATTVIDLWKLRQK